MAGAKKENCMQKQMNLQFSIKLFSGVNFPLMFSEWLSAAGFFGTDLAFIIDTDGEHDIKALEP